MNTPTVMIVDDEPHVIRVLRLALERAGFRVASASDGAAALAAMAHGRPAALVSDIQMAGMDGRALCRAVRERYPDEPFPIIVMSSLPSIEERAWASHLAAVEFVEKPVSPRQLVARLAACVEAAAAAGSVPCSPAT